MSSKPLEHPTAIVRFDALGIVDGAGVSVSPGSLLVEFAPRAATIFPARVLAVGTPAQVDSHEAARSLRLITIRRPSAVLIPGLVNAHTHLDLTHIRPQPHDPGAGFVPWVHMIRTRRAVEPEAIAASVRRGAELSLGAGVVAVGDIAGAVRGQMTLEPWRALRQSPLVGVSWLEFFGIGKGQPRSEQMLGRFTEELANAAGERIRLGLQPHAPNTVARQLYARAIELVRDLPEGSLTTHLAETPEEREFVGQGSGPQREMLESLGLWNDSITADLGRGLHPVEHLRPLLEQCSFAAAHVNDADDAAIEILASTRTRVVYCPRASDYFAAHTHFGPHRYREMLGAGVIVALGTDSIVNLPPSAAWLPTEHGEGRGMSILEEMRFLRRRDGADLVQLLRMGTVHGAMALGLDPDAFGFGTGRPLAGLVAVPTTTFPANDPAALAGRILDGSGQPELLFANIFSYSTEIDRP